MPRIAILCTSPGFGGLELNTIKLAGWLEERNWEVGVLALEGSEFHQKAQEAGLPVTATRKGKRRLALRRWLREFEADILFTPYNKDIALGANYRRWHKNIRFVYQQQMKVGIPKRDFIHTRRYKAIDLWISPLSYLKDEVVRLTKVQPERISIIPLGLDAAPFLKPAIPASQARQDLGLPQQSMILGVLGRIDPQKGQDFLIRTLKPLEDTAGLECHLLIVGKSTPGEGDDYMNQLRTLVQANDLVERVHFRGYTANPSMFFQAIDIFCLPSHGETYGMVTLEAMASGCPVIGTDSDGTQELLQYGKLGALYQKDNVQDFCQKLQQLCADPALPENLEAARAEVLDKYTKEQMLDMMEREFQALLAP